LPDEKFVGEKLVGENVALGKSQKDEHARSPNLGTENFKLVQRILFPAFSFDIMQ
jgi:hypothetical protein